jgi:hypothetical protein
MKHIRFILLITVIALATLACSFSVGSPNPITGSGVVEKEERPSKAFNRIELQGSADVEVTIGETQSVVVEADDNVLPLIRTSVSGGNTLVINWKPNTNIRNYQTVRVIVTVPSLEAVKITGSGNVTVNGLKAADVRFDLPGSGNITAVGQADRLRINLGGSGNIFCESLQTRDVTVDLTGSGNIQVYATDSLDVTVRGSGNVFYRGNPANVEKSTPGSGNISPMP